LESLDKIATALEVNFSELFQPVTNRQEDSAEALVELKRILNKKNFKDGKLLLAVYKTICEHSKN